MSYWVELHCDAENQKKVNRYGNLACMTKGGHLCIGALVNSPNEAVRSLHDAARRNGWTKRGKLWICPPCAAPAVLPEPLDNSNVADES